jgi:sugar/nucleoside kinase (ribokinase family)
VTQRGGEVGATERGVDQRAADQQAPTDTHAERDPAQLADIFLAGTVFHDIIFTGLVTAPAGGHEIWTDGMGSSPGGVANLAVACARLGLRTSLAAAFGGDVYGDYCWSMLEQAEGVDLSHSSRFEGWHSPVTVSLAYDQDRAMVTHAHPPPVSVDEMIGSPPPSKVCFTDLGRERGAWVDEAVARGSLVFCDVGWDSTGEWNADELVKRLAGCHAFVPNATEAMSYTRTDSPGAALEQLREWVPLAVVTTGSGGAFAADAGSGETAWVPAVPVTALDPTGAGDVFLAALVVGTLRGWSLNQRLRFANLCAALSVRDFGGALAAPGWQEVADWWAAARNSARHARDFAFLDDVLAQTTPRAVSRAAATIGLRPLDPFISAHSFHRHDEPHDPEDRS